MMKTKNLAKHDNCDTIQVPMKENRGKIHINLLRDQIKTIVSGFSEILQHFGVTSRLIPIKVDEQRFEY